LGREPLIFSEQPQDGGHPADTAGKVRQHLGRHARAKGMEMFNAGFQALQRLCVVHGRSFQTGPACGIAAVMSV
jgi:hypothetical protein